MKKPFFGNYLWFYKKSKGAGLFLHGLPPLANEAGKLNYPFNRRNLRGITFY
jgi:hypothetical protein